MPRPKRQSRGTKFWRRAFAVCIYGKGLFHYQQRVKVSECKGKEFATIESKQFTINELKGRETVIWFALVKRPPEELEAVYINDVILMKAQKDTTARGDCAL